MYISYWLTAGMGEFLDITAAGVGVATTTSFYTTIAGKCSANLLKCFNKKKRQKKS